MIKFWRVGPNPMLTLIAWAGAGIEALTFNWMSETFLVGMFQILLFTSLLWYWMTVVWIWWGAARTLKRLNLTRWRRMAALTIIRMFACLLIIIYALAWVIFSQVHLFPDAHWIAFFQSSYEVLLYEAERSSGHLLPWFYGFCAVTVVAVMFFPRHLLVSKWPDSTGRKLYTMVSVTWVLLAAVAWTSYTRIKAQRDATTRQTELTKFSTSVNPVFTFAASMVPDLNSRIIPNMDTSSLEPIVSDAVIYSGNELTTRPMSVLYLAVESLRGDLLFKEHQGKEITPHLNALARRSIVFSNAYAQASHTDYALPALLSSQYPLRAPEHYYYERNEPWPNVRIYDHLHRYGYETAIISSDTTNWGEVRKYLWSPDLDVFFDAENLPTTYSAVSANRGYVTNFKATPRTESKSVPDREVVDFDIAWMSEMFAGDRPFFLHSFFYQPHYPYTIDDSVPRVFQPSEIDFESTFLWFPQDKLDIMRNAYYNAVHETDTQIGRLVEFLASQGQTSNTIIMVTADHGEAFNEHGVAAHAGPLFNEVVHIPCLIFVPGASPQRVDYPVQQIDMPPTLCALLGIAPHPGFQGIDVLSPGRPPLDERDLYLTAEPPASWRGDAIVHAGRWKFMHDRYDDLYLLFDMQNDPDESLDLKNQFPDLAVRLYRKLRDWRNEQLTYYTFKSYYEHYYPPDK